MIVTTMTVTMTMMMVFVLVMVWEGVWGEFPPPIGIRGLRDWGLGGEVGQWLSLHGLRHKASPDFHTLQ